MIMKHVMIVIITTNNNENNNNNKNKNRCFTAAHSLLLNGVYVSYIPHLLQRYDSVDISYVINDINLEFRQINYFQKEMGVCND